MILDLGNIKLWVILNFMTYVVTGCRRKVAVDSLTISRLNDLMIFLLLPENNFSHTGINVLLVSAA